MNTDKLRQRLMQQGIKHSELDSSPLKQFAAWYKQTIEADIYEPGAMSLATVDADGQPWQRIMLFYKRIGECLLDFVPQPNLYF